MKQIQRSAPFHKWDWSSLAQGQHCGQWTAWWFDATRCVCHDKYYHNVCVRVIGWRTVFANIRCFFRRFQSLSWTSTDIQTMKSFKPWSPNHWWYTERWEKINLLRFHSRIMWHYAGTDFLRVACGRQGSSDSPARQYPCPWWEHLSTLPTENDASGYRSKWGPACQSLTGIWTGRHTSLPVQHGQTSEKQMEQWAVLPQLSPTSRLQASFGVLPKRPEGRSRWGVSCVGVWRTLEASCGSPRRSQEPCDLVQKHAAEISPFNCCMPGILSVSFCTK